MAAGLCGLLILLTFWVDSAGYLREATLIRFLVAAVYLLREVPLHKRTRAPGALPLTLRLAVALIGSGMLAVVVFPHYRLAMDHVLYIGGVGLLVLTIATRVILGHSGHQSLMKRWSWPLAAMAILMVLAMATRTTADFLGERSSSHQVYASWCWIGGALIWGIAIIPKVLIPDPES